MPTAIYFTTDAEMRVEESPAEVEDVLSHTGPIARLTLTNGETLYFRVDQVTHWHQTEDPATATAAELIAASDRAR